MQFFTVAAAAVAFASGALAGAGGGSASTPATFVLNQDSANTLVAQYKSVLENATYNGLTPNQTAQLIVAEDYHEYSDSIQSLISSNNTLGANTLPTATTREEWFKGVTANPDQNITTIDVYVAGDDAILWYWIFPFVGSQNYPVKGFNLLRVDSTGVIYEADIEFNSIAWGVDIHAIGQYCGSAPSGNTTATGSSTSVATPPPQGTYTSTTTTTSTIVAKTVTSTITVNSNGATVSSTPAAASKK